MDKEKQKDGPPWSVEGKFETYQHATAHKAKISRKGLDVKIRRRRDGYVVKSRNHNAQDMLTNAP